VELAHDAALEQRPEVHSQRPLRPTGPRLACALPRPLATLAGRP
jgi:hypothetical protein